MLASQPPSISLILLSSFYSSPLELDLDYYWELRKESVQHWEAKQRDKEEEGEEEGTWKWKKANRQKLSAYYLPSTVLGNVPVQHKEVLQGHRKNSWEASPPNHKIQIPLRQQSCLTHFIQPSSYVLWKETVLKREPAIEWTTVMEKEGQI